MLRGCNQKVLEETQEDACGGRSLSASIPFPSPYSVWPGVVSIYPARAVAKHRRLHSHLIACHMKSFVFCHHGTADQYCQQRVRRVCVYMCACVCEGVTNEFEYLRGKGSFEGCSSISVILLPGVHRSRGLCAHTPVRTEYCDKHAIWHIHAVTHCLAVLPSSGLKSGWTLAGKPH